jgi:phenylacetate-coenzyme A ligase PaaK-like adenylate-forming protein
VRVAALARLKVEQRRRRRSDVDGRLARLLRRAGYEGASLDEVPVLTKADLVERFDELVTDRRLRRAELADFVRANPAGGAFGRYRLALSSGSTGRPALVAFDPQEWAGLLAASAAMRALAGSPTGRQAKVGSPSPWHLSAQLGATLQDPRRPALRLPVTTPIDTLVAELERFGPALLTAYPSVLGLLAGRADVAPTHVFGGGEVLTGATRRRVREAWGVEPFDQYVTTEAGPIAGECEAHAGMHVLGDHVVLEVVDATRRPVPAGTYGDAVLVTTLSSRTIPLLRYELSDRVCLLAEPCACGRPGPRVAGIAGRAREVLRLGGVAVHPSVLTGVLDIAAVAGWQVVQRGEAVRVLVTGPGPTFERAALGDAVAAALDGVGARASVDVEVVDRLEAPSGKASLFVLEPPS